MHKTAYELRISAWSSDVCSSDLSRIDPGHSEAQRLEKARQRPSELEATHDILGQIARSLFLLLAVAFDHDRRVLRRLRRGDRWKQKHRSTDQCNCCIVPAIWDYPVLSHPLMISQITIKSTENGRTADILLPTAQRCLSARRNSLDSDRSEEH